MEVISNTISDLEMVSGKITGFAGNKKIWLFFGEMGAGKTTLIKSICKYHGVVDTVSSPTYSIVNEYQNKTNNLVYHFDFYRIKNQEEALDIGVEEYLESGNLCLIEWPEKIPDLLPDQYLSINISVNSNEQRIITLSHHG